MIKVRFLSFLSHDTGVKEIHYDLSGTVSDVIEKLCIDFPSIADLLELDNPEVSLILNDKSLYLPKDLDIEVSGELIVSPIIAGG